MRIVLADDHRLFREGLCATLETVEAYNVVAQVGTAEALLEELGSTVCDHVFLDYHMPGGGALKALDSIKINFSKTKVIVLSGADVSSIYQRFIDLKADGVLIKDISSKLLLESVVQVINGEQIISPEIVEFIKADQSEITLREFQVMELIVTGLNNTQIAKQLNLSNKTIANHRYNLMQKLELKNSVELMHHALKIGLIPQS
jgi:DNA-binding NarL/FixJ family response regulator